MSESPRFQETSSFKMQGPDGVIVTVTVFVEFVDEANQWSTTRPDWKETNRKRYLGSGGRPVLAVPGEPDVFVFEDEPERAYVRISQY